MRWVVEGCSPVFSLISFSDTASSREASTSMSANMRAITWMVGVGGVVESVFRMGGPSPAFYLVKSTRAQPDVDRAALARHRVARIPLAVVEDLVREELGLVGHLGALRDPVAQ